MGDCTICSEPCDGEPYVLYVEDRPVMARQYCDDHHPETGKTVRRVIGTASWTPEPLTVKVVWKRGRDVLDQIDPLKQAYERGKAAGELDGYRKALHDKTPEGMEEARQYEKDEPEYDPPENEPGDEAEPKPCHFFWPCRE